VLAPKELEHNLLFHIYDEIQRACGKDILAGVTDRKGLGTTVLNICLKYYATMYRDLELGWREHLLQRSVLEAVSAALLLGSLLRVGPLRPWLFAFGLGVLALAVAEARKGSRVGIRIVVAGFLRQKMAQGAPKE